MYQTHSFFLLFSNSEDEAEAIRLLQSGGDANAKDDDGYTPMNYAAEYGNGSKHNDCIKEDQFDFQLILLGYDRVVQLLIDKGYSSQIHTPNKWGNTPLLRAIQFGNFHLDI